ncbi:MAG: hypothetical protein HQL28_03290, partial [Candidatus Omnitrophica bacterium]|nr:hypothetical protein [Candidatus Omnitrophota bacterium]
MLSIVFLANTMCLGTTGEVPYFSVTSFNPAFGNSVTISHEKLQVQSIFAPLSNDFARVSLKQLEEETIFLLEMILADKPFTVCNAMLDAKFAPVLPNANRSIRLDPQKKHSFTKTGLEIPLTVDLSAPAGSVKSGNFIMHVPCVSAEDLREKLTNCKVSGIRILNPGETVTGVSDAAVSSKNIGGQDADNQTAVNPAVRYAVEKGTAVKIRFGTVKKPNGSLGDRYYIPRYVERYIKGDDDTRKNIEPILSEEESAKLKGYLTKYLPGNVPVRSVTIGVLMNKFYVKDRAFGLPADETYAIAHAGLSTKTIWFGEIFLKEILKENNRTFAEYVFEHEVKHLIDPEGAAVDDGLLFAWNKKAKLKELCLDLELSNNEFILNIARRYNTEAEKERFLGSVRTFLANGRKYKKNIFDDVDKMDGADIMKLADKYIEKHIKEESRIELKRPKGLRELFLYPSIGSFDVLQHVFCRMPFFGDEFYWDDASIDEEVLEVYVLVRAIRELSVDDKKPLISGKDVNDLAAYVKAWGDVRTVERIMSLAKLVLPADSAPKKIALINLMGLLSALSDPDAGTKDVSFDLSYLSGFRGKATDDIRATLRKIMAEEKWRKIFNIENTGERFFFSLKRVEPKKRSESAVIFHDYYIDLLSKNLELFKVLSHRMMGSAKRRSETLAKRDRIVGELLDMTLAFTPDLFITPDEKEKVSFINSRIVLAAGLILRDNESAACWCLNRPINMMNREKTAEFEARLAKNSLISRVEWITDKKTPYKVLIKIGRHIRREGAKYSMLTNSEMK